MPALFKRTLLMLVAALATALPSTRTLAEDIDVFVGASGGGAANVLFVIDNTSNWAQQKQAWPGGITQGQSELLAIKNVISRLNLDPQAPAINVGMMLFNDIGSGSCCTGGYVRFAMQPLTNESRQALMDLLQKIYDNFETPEEKVGSSANYSGILFDAYKYFGGYTSPAHALDNVAGTPTNQDTFGPDVFARPPSTYSFNADSRAYTSASLSRYFPPASTLDACGGRNFIIFIGNGFPNTDGGLTSNLRAVGGNTDQMAMPVLQMVTSEKSVDLTGLGDAGYSSACYPESKKGLSDCNTDVANACGPTYDKCSCNAAASPRSCSKGPGVQYGLTGTITTTVAKPTGASAVPGPSTVRLADEWARFLFQTDVSPASGQQNVTTYTVDVFNAKQDGDQTALLYNIAQAGGGKYFAARSQTEIESAIGAALVEINAANSAFASASLPISATNRAVNENQVFIGMFRPDPKAAPRWFGNLKRYQIAEFNGDYKLADAKGLDAINTVTGFVTDCATSYWTSDSGKYWEGKTIEPSPAGTCTSTDNSPFSDAPDGPKVEKGGVAEVLRKGNGGDAWTLNRTIYTKNFAKFDTTSSGLPEAVVNFIQGFEVDSAGNTVPYSFVDESGTTRETKVRASIHGDVVHSRPLPVSYGSGTTVVYYGANDGTFRAINADTGRERWAYVAPEFYSTLERLWANEPVIAYSFITGMSITPPPKPKNYYFDGSIGLYQNADNSKVWIYPTMRRGGRMIYAFDVTNPGSPSLKWKVGCPLLSSDAGCTSGYTGIGQTWSTPNVANVNVDGTVKPVLVVGGGYDNCEDGVASDACTGGKGSWIYVIDADNGDLLKSFPTDGRVVADVSLVDVDNDNVVDYGYVGDTRGSVYRLTFGPSKTAPLTKATWVAPRIAYTSGANRKFMYAPALLAGFDRATNRAYIYLALGTGDREQPLYTQYPFATPVLNRFYVYMDEPLTTGSTDLDGTAMNDYSAAGGCDAAQVLPGSSKKGWLMDLPGTGEQTVTSAIIVGGVVAFSTYQAFKPEKDACKPAGQANGYVVNLFNASGAIGVPGETCGGSRSAAFAGNLLPPSPVFSNVKIGDTVQPIVLGVANLKGGASSAIQGQLGFNLKPQRRTRIYYRQEGNN